MVFLCGPSINFFFGSFLLYYSLRFKIIVSLAFFCLNNCHFRIPMQHLLLFFHYYTRIYWISSNLTIPLTTINKGILVNDINFIIEINTIYHFLKNRTQTLKDYYFEMEGVYVNVVPKTCKLADSIAVSYLFHCLAQWTRMVSNQILRLIFFLYSRWNSRTLLQSQKKRLLHCHPKLLIIHCLCRYILFFLLLNWVWIWSSLQRFHLWTIFRVHGFKLDVLNMSWVKQTIHTLPINCLNFLFKIK